MTAHLLETLGIYGGAVVIAFLAGLFPLMSIEVFLIGLVTLGHITIAQLGVLVVLAAVGHQIAKTLTFYAGVGALEVPRGRVHEKIQAARKHIDRWNKHPYFVLFLASTVGLPPVYLIGFIAHPLMRIRFWPFTLICFFGRIGRYAVMSSVPLLWK